jgi:hypothetical protein
MEILEKLLHEVIFHERSLAQWSRKAILLVVEGLLSLECAMANLLTVLGRKTKRKVRDRSLLFSLRIYSSSDSSPSSSTTSTQPALSVHIDATRTTPSAAIPGGLYIAFGAITTCSVQKAAPGS